MSEARWLEMPTVAEGGNPSRPRPKYQVASRAVLVYREDKVYVHLGDETTRAAVKAHPDVRTLSATEIRELERTRPFIRLAADGALEPLDASWERQRAERSAVLLGDVIARLARAVGIAECGPCKRRRRRLNRIPLWGWWRLDEA
jgi:hypothetical protein